MWLDPGSNRGHMDFQSIALPTELSSLKSKAEIKLEIRPNVKRRDVKMRKFFPGRKNQADFINFGRSRSCSWLSTLS